MKKIFTVLFFAVFCLLMLNVTKATDMPTSCNSTGGVNVCARSTGNTVGEWELANGTVSPEYQTSCASGLTSLYPYTWYSQLMMGASVLCYNAQKWLPVCKDDTASAKAGWYYPNGSLLRAMTCNQWAVQKKPVACTMEYAPVCWAVQVQCIKAPCNPIPQTFANSCELKAQDNATLLYVGECKWDLKAGEWFVYDSIAKVLDTSYLVWHYTPIQAANYTQTIIDKIDAILEKSKMTKLAYDKHIQLKRFLQIYISLGQK